MGFFELFCLIFWLVVTTTRWTRNGSVLLPAVQPAILLRLADQNCFISDPISEGYAVVQVGGAGITLPLRWNLLFSVAERDEMLYLVSVLRPADGKEPSREQASRRYHDETSTSTKFN